LIVATGSITSWSSHRLWLLFGRDVGDAFGLLPLTAFEEADNPPADAHGSLRADWRINSLGEQQALPNVARAAFEIPDAGRLKAVNLRHPPRVLLLYGSLRQRSYSRFLTLEAAQLLQALGAETRIFDPTGLPLPDDAPDSHRRVEELRSLSVWSEAQVWCSPERHGAMTAIMKAQIDWIPLTLGALRPTRGKTLAVMQVSGGEQSFNAVNQLRVLGRWMQMITIPNQTSVAKAHEQFDDAGRMLPSPYYDRLVDVMEELMKLTYLTRGVSDYLTNRYSERKEKMISRKPGEAPI
jgi:arsenic resistance protein ArsH